MCHKSLAYFVFLAVTFSIFGCGSAIRCKKEVLFGFDTVFDCPRPGEPETHTFCCGDDDDPHCCPSPFGDIDQETIDALVESLPKILGILFGVVVIAFVLCIVCCCCCPFCLFAKKRRAGQIHRGTAEVTVTVPPQQAAQPLQPYPQPQPGYPPQAGYPAQPQPGYPGQPQPGYPGAGAPVAPTPGYPEQPPPYSEKQPAFNPNYGA